MHLYLAQHGAALDKTVNPDRPLSPDGVTNVKHVAAMLAASGISPARILHSGKTRAMETAALFGESLPSASPAEAVPGIAPNDAVEAFAVTTAAWNQDVLICGHQPFMGRLASYLLCGNAVILTLDYVPGAVAALARNENDGWRLSWFLRPEIRA